VTAGAFSLNGEEVITQSTDKSVRVWETQTGRELRRFDGTAIDADWVTFTLNGRYVLSTDDKDYSVSMWPISYHDTINSVCSLLLRDFNDDERVQYGITDKNPTCPAR
jgi:WD40 repeat protein